MSRYQIVYSKRGLSLTTWKNDMESARTLANEMRKAGYSVDVWEHTKDGARRTNL